VPCLPVRRLKLREENNVKKAGIVTFHNADNYGAVLQCFAMQEYLKNSGNTAEIIDYMPCYFKRKYRAYTPFLDTYKQYKLLGKNKVFLRTLKAYCTNVKIYGKYKKSSAFEKFRRKYFNLTKRFENFSEFAEICSDFDVISVGSDQVWSKRITGGKYDPVFFLKGIDDKIVKISYAASCGGIFEEKDYDEVSKMLKDFNCLAARENDLAQQVSDITGKNCEHVVDPVFLLTKEQWLDKFGNNKFAGKKYIFAYNVSSEATTEEYFRRVDELASKYGYEIYEVGKKKRTKGKGKLFHYAGPEEFVQLIAGAELVFTTSFHATALSVIFKKQFYVFLPNNSNRIISLLNRLDIPERLVYPGGDISCKEIEYDRVSILTDEMISSSEEYLINSINTDKN